MTEEPTPAAHILESLRQISDLDIEEDLVRTSDLGRQLDFSGYRPLFTEIHAFVGILESLSWNDVPVSEQNSVAGSSANLKQYLQEVRDFSSREMSEAERNNRGQRVESGFDDLRRQAIPLVGYLSWKDLRIEEIRENLDSVADASRAEARELTSEIERIKVEAESALSTIREAAAEQGVTQEAATFREAANRYSATSTRWLWTSVFAALVTIGAAFGLVLAWATDGQITDAEVLQLVLVKAAMLAVLTYGTITAVRLYRSNVHLAAVNRHREDALRTFRSFVEGTESPETKDQVLLAAARAAFGQTSTGLISEKGDSANMLEVLAGIANNVGRRS